MDLGKAYGAMMTLAFDMGNSFPSIVGGTLLRKSSSSRARTSGLASYQLSAWVALRVPDCCIVPVYDLFWSCNERRATMKEE